MILFEHLWNLVHLVPPWLCERILEINIPIIRWFVYDINAIKKPECLRIVCLTVKCSFRSSPLSCCVEHAINRILGTNTPLFLKAQNYPVLALTKINVVIYSSRSEIKGFLKMLLNEFVCGRIITRQYGPGIACRQTVRGLGFPGEWTRYIREMGPGFMRCQELDTRASFYTESSGKLTTFFIYIPQRTIYITNIHAFGKRLN